MNIKFKIIAYKLSPCYTCNHGPRGERDAASKCYGNAFSMTTLWIWITCVMSPMDGWDVTGGVTYRQGNLKARVVEPASASRNEASARRDAGSMTLRRSISFPLGTMVTCVTWRCSPSGTRAASKRYGNKYAHAARLTNPCLVLKSTMRAREQKSLVWLAYRGHRTWRTLGAWTIPQRCRCPA